ncbi:MAG: hypothetical protein A2Y38_17370 [Spirochaetes bacterium GWB1_59_5]|nr:MAG: hypothetical protein A2Y38_17370 [Spirochaetes bacterium GWB1_59_5]
MSKDKITIVDGVNVHGENIREVRAVLKRKVARLGRLLELDAPNYILTMEVAAIFRTMAGLDPDAIGKHMMRWVARGVRRSYGMCNQLDCDTKIDLNEIAKTVPPTDPYFFSGLCVECWNNIHDEDTEEGDVS